MTPAADRRIRGEGETTEVEWRTWLDRLAPPPLPATWRARGDTRLVVVSPHPDDEVLACGGLIAAQAAAGGRIAIVAVTDGEASHRDDPRWPAQRLAARRGEERLQGLARLGVGADAVTRLGLPDGAVDGARDALRDALRGLLGRGDVVVATWPLDGHPDHDASGAVAEAVCGERGCALLQAPVWMWHWSRPADPRVPWDRLRSVHLGVDARVRKLRALAAHRTQLTARGHEIGAVLGTSIRARAARTAEYFFV